MLVISLTFPQIATHDSARRDAVFLPCVALLPQEEAVELRQQALLMAL